MPYNDSKMRFNRKYSAESFIFKSIIKLVYGLFSKNRKNCSKTFKWFMVKPHTSHIRMTYEYIQVTYGWHTNTYEWHMDDIPVYTSDISLYTSKYEWHADNIRVYTDDIRMTDEYIQIKYEHIQGHTSDIRVTCKWHKKYLELSDRNFQSYLW